MKNFRIHGNGFIQADLGEDLRIHVWHPDLPKQKVSTPIHNHCFSFSSRVVVGAIEHREFEVVNVGRNAGDKVVYNKYRAQHRDREDTVLVKESNAIYTAESKKKEKIVRAGKVYTFKRGAYHTTFPQFNGIAATIMERFNVGPDIQPTILCLVDEEPDNEFHRYTIMDPVQLEKMVRQVLMSKYA